MVVAVEKIRSRWAWMQGSGINGSYVMVNIYIIGIKTVVGFGLIGSKSIIFL